MAGIFRREAFAGEHMPEMRVTIGAYDFDPPAISIGNPFYRTGDFIVEARPAAMGIKFRIGRIQRGIAAPAHVESLLLVMQVLSRPGKFGAFVNDDPFFFWAQWVPGHSS